MTNTEASVNTHEPHIHRDFIVQWANGCTIEQYVVDTWYVDAQPTWREQGVYRVKPQPKLDVVMYGNIDDTTKNIYQYSDSTNLCGHFNSTKTDYDNLKVVYSGETGLLLSVELIK